MGTPLASRTLTESVTVEGLKLCWLPWPPPVGRCAKAEEPQTKSIQTTARSSFESVNMLGRTQTMETLTPRKTYRYTTQQKVCRQALGEAEGAATRQKVGHTGKSLQFELVFVFL